MTEAYPIVITIYDDDYVVYVPDFDINTQGTSITNAIEMARDAIGGAGMSMENRNLELPTPSKIEDVQHEKNDIVTLVDVDFADYRRKNERKVVKKNCTLPSWLCYEAEKANINFSAVLQKALKAELNLEE